MMNKEKFDYECYTCDKQFKETEDKVVIGADSGVYCSVKCLNTASQYKCVSCKEISFDEDGKFFAKNPNKFLCDSCLYEDEFDYEVCHVCEKVCMITDENTEEVEVDLAIEIVFVCGENDECKKFIEENSIDDDDEEYIEQKKMEDKKFVSLSPMEMMLDINIKQLYEDSVEYVKAMEKFKVFVQTLEATLDSSYRKSIQVGVEKNIPYMIISMPYGTLLVSPKSLLLAKRKDGKLTVETLYQYGKNGFDSLNTIEEYARVNSIYSYILILFDGRRKFKL